MARTRKYSNEQIIKALKETKGLVYVAAEKIGCDADTIYLRARSTPSVARTIKEARGRFVDKSEMKLEQAVDNGEAWAIAMVLKTLGKDRGYTEKQEIDLSLDDKVIKILKGVSMEDI